MFDMTDLREFRILTNEATPGTSCAELRINSSKLIFNKLAAAELGYPHHVNVLFGKNFEEIVVLPADDTDSKYAIPFYQGGEIKTRTGETKKKSTIDICNKSLAKSIRAKRGWGGTQTKKIKGIRYPQKTALYFDLRTAVDAKARACMHQKATDALFEALPTFEQALLDMRPVYALPSGDLTFDSEVVGL